MKKLLFIAVIFMLSLNLYAERDLSITSSELYESPEIQQTSDWEYLGKINAASSLFLEEFDLYVKIIGGKEFYQVRKGTKRYAVTIGRYKFNDNYYNATFRGEGGSRYYFNI